MLAARAHPPVSLDPDPRTFDLMWADWGIGVQHILSGRSSPDGTWTEVIPFAEPWKVTNFVVREICAAVQLSASPLPGSIYRAATHEALAVTVASAGTGLDHAATVVPALASGSLPMFVGVPPKTLVTMRKTEAAFDDWRSELRNAVGLVRRTSATPGFGIEAEQRLNDALVPRMHELRKLAARASRARSGAREAAVGFAVAAVTATARGGTDLGSALLAAGAGSVTSLASRILFLTVALE